MLVWKRDENYKPHFKQLAVCLSANIWHSVQTADSLSQCKHLALTSNSWQSVSVQTFGTQFKQLAVCLSANVWHSDSMQTAGTQTQIIQSVLWLNALIQARQITLVLLHYKGIHKYVFTRKAWGSHSATIDDASYSQILCFVEWLVVTDILQNQSAFIFRAKQYRQHDGPS